MNENPTTTDLGQFPQVTNRQFSTFTNRRSSRFGTVTFHGLPVFVRSVDSETGGTMIFLVGDRVIGSRRGNRRSSSVMFMFSVDGDRISRSRVDALPFD